MTTADHVLINTQATLEITFTAGDAAGDVTYAVTDANGAAVQSGTATNESQAGRYTFVLAPQDDVKQLTIVWTGTWQTVEQSITTYAEIVGGHLFTIAEARAFDNAALANDTTYPDATLRETRAGITDFFEDVCRRSFIPRYRRETHDNPHSTDLWLQRRHEIRRVISATLSGTALTPGEIADVIVYPSGRLYRRDAWPSSNGFITGAGNRGSVIVEYEHGCQSVPYAIHRAALILARYWLIPSDVTDRAVSFTNDGGGFVRLSVASERFPTGIPPVDAALFKYGAGTPLIA